MHHTGYGLPPNAAQGYKLEDDRLHRASFIDVSVPYAAGGLFSTVQDLRRFVSSLFEGRLISKSSLAAMLTPIYERQASGWIVDEFHGREMIWHSGGINGHSSHIAYLPDQRLAVIVLSNRETGTADKAARDLTSIVLDEPYVFPICGEPFEIEPNILSAYVGDYEIKPGIVATITALDQSLYVQIGGQEKFRAYAISATRFMVREVNAELRFEREPNGECGLIVRQYYKMFVAQRVK
jgi:CubicO group peptidase (beta-lactamase class C family)